MPSSDAEKAKKLKQAYQAFMKEIGTLRKDRLHLISKVIGRTDQQKIQEILDTLKQ
jgi:hypothetical protein